jgi:polyhydroxybutyrate depolymerase
VSVLAATVALAAPIAGCSGDDGDAGAGAQTTASSAAATSAPGAATTAPPEPSPVRSSEGCGVPPDVVAPEAERPGDVEQTFASGGVDRLYRLGVPGSYDPDEPVPLVLNLHGSGSNAIQASIYHDIARAAAARGWVTVTPEGLDGRWELAGTGDDNDFLLALVDDVSARYCIDLDRVHLVGLSLGAWKAAITACANPGRFASLSLVTVEVFPGECEPVAVVAFHGTADRVVPYGEGGEVGIEVDGLNGQLPGARTNIENWARSNGCDPEPEVDRLGDDVERLRYTGCTDGADVVLHTIEGGGHTWPGSPIDVPGLGAVTQTIDATELTLDWFEQHPRQS